MAGYIDSKYYSILDSLVNSGAIYTEEGQRKMLDALDNELGWPNHGGDWLAYHFNSSAEYLCENERSKWPSCWQSLVETARNEIEIFRKHNYTRQADWMQSLLDEVLNH